MKKCYILQRITSDAQVKMIATMTVKTIHVVKIVRCGGCKKNGKNNDYLLGQANTREEAWNLLKDDTDIEGSGGWDYEYVQEFLKKYFEE